MCDAEYMLELEKCVLSACPPGDVIQFRKLEATVCDLPSRNRSTTIQGVMWSFFGIATLFTALRFISRAPSYGGAGCWLDDWSTILCYLPLLGLTVGTMYQIYNGLGQNDYQLSVDDIEKFLKFFYAGQTLYVAIIFLSKVSLLLLYLRIWPVDPTRSTLHFRSACWIVLAAVMATWIAFQFVVIFQCTPVSNFWSAYTGSNAGACIDRTAAGYSAASLDIFYDVVIIGLPIPKLLGMPTSTPRRLGICIVYLVGLGTIASACVRISYLTALASPANVTWNYTNLSIWSMLEANLSIICTCMPATAGLFQKPRSHRFSSPRPELPTMSEERERIRIQHLGPASLDEKQISNSENSDSSDSSHAPSSPGPPPIVSPTFAHRVHASLRQSEILRQQKAMEEGLPVETTPARLSYRNQNNEEREMDVTIVAGRVVLSPPPSRSMI